MYTISTLTPEQRLELFERVAVKLIFEDQIDPLRLQQILARIELAREESEEAAR